MRYLSAADIDQIATWEDAYCVSLFMPVKRAEVDLAENFTRLRHLVARAQDLLVERGLSRNQAESQLAAVAKLIDHREFWRERGIGLAAFVAGDRQRVFHLDHPLQEEVSVDDHCDIVPVVTPSVDDERFAVLAYSPKRVRLFVGDRRSLSPVDSAQLPQDMEQYTQLLSEQDSVQHHAHLAPQHGAPHTEGQAEYHGHGGGGDLRLRNLRLAEFSRMVNAAVCDQLKPEGLPLLVAASDTLWPIYHVESNYPNLIDEPLRGNPDELKEDDLHRRAWAVMEERIEQTRQQDQAAFQEAVGRNGSSQLGEVLPAAHEGRVETLLVSSEDHIWGKFDPERRKIHTSPRPDGRNHDLLRLTALLTRRNGGRVRALPRERIPGQAPMAAVFRY